MVCSRDNKKTISRARHTNREAVGDRDAHLRPRCAPRVDLRVNLPHKARESRRPDSAKQYTILEIVTLPTVRYMGFTTPTDSDLLISAWWRRTPAQAGCSPAPKRRGYGGMLGCVATLSPFRRTMAAFAFR